MAISEEGLWKAKDLLQFLNCGKSTLHDTILRQPDFPTPSELTIHGCRRWVPDEVRAWVESKRAT
jgi:predicted DNA-binding transcriptional regulator AlpA